VKALAAMRLALSPLLLCLGLGLGACGDFPQVEAAHAGLSRDEAPRLVPIEGLIAQATPGRATAAARDGLAARAAGLRARAAAMRGPVQSPATRARLAAAIAAHPALMSR